MGTGISEKRCHERKLIGSDWIGRVGKCRSEMIDGLYQRIRIGALRSVAECKKVCTDHILTFSEARAEAVYRSVAVKT